MKKLVRSLLASLLTSIALMSGPVENASANEGGYAWGTFPSEKLSDMAALQNGAKLFVNYCLNCHSAAAMRYNRLTDIGLTNEQIKANLLFTTDKIGDLMKVALSPKDAKDWFGVVPPDLSVVARA